jgi:hypothetical protein
MVAFNGKKRSKESEVMMNVITSREWFASVSVSVYRLRFLLFTCCS